MNLFTVVKAASFFVKNKTARNMAIKGVKSSTVRKVAVSAAKKAIKK